MVADGIVVVTAVPFGWVTKTAGKTYTASVMMKPHLRHSVEEVSKTRPGSGASLSQRHPRRRPKVFSGTQSRFHINRLKVVRRRSLAVMHVLLC
jgi:ribosomal protein L44E